MVLAPPFDFDKINEFICETDIKPSSIKFSRVNPHFTTFFNQFNQEQMIAFKKCKKKNRASFNRKLAKGKELNEVEKHMFRQRFLFIHRRDMEKLDSKVPSNGQCMIGERSLLINTNGSFNFCTRIDDAFNLGNIDSGYDYKRIEKIYFDLEKLLGKRCYGCWAIRLCMKCINDINKNGELDEDVFERFCTKSKSSILNEIKDYIRIRENNYHALDYLEDVTIS
jgi:radical SAM protein with 4Fe4S-binding SPASM domain